MTRWLAWLMALYVVYAIVYVGLWRPMTIFGVDYDIYWQAARAILEGAKPYIGGNLWLKFIYPQATAMVFAWLGLFSFETSEKIWKLTLLVMLGICWWLAWRFYRPAARPDADVPDAATPDADGRAALTAAWSLVCAFAVSCYQPAMSSLNQGNIDPFNALLAVAMVAALLASKPRTAGALWAGLTLVKMMPLVLIVPILLWRRWRVLQGFLIVMAVYFVALVATGHLGHEWYFVREFIPVISRWWREISISPVRLGLYLSGFAHLYDNPLTFDLTIRVYVAIMVALYLAFLVALRRRGVDWMRALEAAILVYPLLSPLLEYHHFVWIFPALFLQLRRWAEGRMSSSRAAGLLAGWILLQVGYLLSFQFFKWGIYVQFTPLVGYALILLFFMLDLPKGQAQSNALELPQPATGS